MSELSAPLPCPFCGSSYIESIMPGRWACDVCGASAKRWNNRAAPPAVGGEPVAWWRTREDGETLGIFYGAHPPKWGARSEWTPLYAAPRESPIPIDGERWNGMARAMQRIGAAGTEEEIEKQLRDAYSDSSASPEDEIRPWRWHSSMDDVVPETGQRAENVPVRSPDKGGAAGNGVAAGAERHVVHPAALPLEAAPPRPTVETTSPTSPGDTSSSGGSGAPSALDVAALARGLRARNLTVNDLAAAALEREHARAESWRLRADHEYARGAAIEAKIAALEAALRAADEMHKQGQRHYHGEPEHRTCPMCAAMDAYRAARDAP